MSSPSTQLNQLLEMIRLERRLDGDASQSLAAREVISELPTNVLLKLEQELLTNLN